MSADAENEGLPGLSRMAWFAHYADFSKEKNVNLLAALRDNAGAIHQQYTQSRASFYIKAFADAATWHSMARFVAKKDLTPAFTTVRKKTALELGKVDENAKGGTD